jgi:hypothetical protein
MASAALAQATAESGAAATAASTAGAATSGTSLTATAVAIGSTAFVIGAHVVIIGIVAYAIGEEIASWFASTPNPTDPKTPHIPNMGGSNNPNPKKPDDDKKKIPEAIQEAGKLVKEIEEEARKNGWTNPDMPALDDAQQINHIFPKNKPDHDPFSLEAYQECRNS